MAGALLYAAAPPAGAQIVPPPASEVPIPVKPPTDTSADSARIKRDTIQPPIGRFADPVLYEIGPQYDYDREELFATGALTLVDLLERIPGLTTFRSGWLATPQTAAFNGDFRRLRVFYDGVEMDNLDPSTGGLLDLSTVQIWTLEHLSIERSANELRLYLRSWRVDNTTPYTRVDVATGNEETNLYHGFYGKRFDRGQVLQFAGQQYGVASSRFAGSGDGLSLLSRVGIARKDWSVDAFVNRSHATRGLQRPSAGRPPIPSLDATHTNAYIRAAIGGVESGPWVQLIAASLAFKGTMEPTAPVSPPPPGTPAPGTGEKRVSEMQYTASAGYTRGPARLELQERVRARNGATYNGLSGRLDFVTGLGVLSAFAEHDGMRGTANADVGIRAEPLPFLALSGSVARTSAGTLLPSSTSARAEVGLKIFGPWVSAGFVTRGAATVPAPIVYDTLFLPATVSSATGTTLSIRGPIAHGVGIDAFVTRWDEARPYAPQYQSRSEINFASSFLNRFPKGDFGVRAAAIYEYREHTDFPLAAGDIPTAVSRTISGMLEIRIMRAVVSYQQRNILAYQYQIIPGFEMPRVLAIYGVRWEFWN